jgi:uncharacterized membrane protein YadS
MRVAMLLPVIVAAAMITRMQGADPTGKRPPLLPWFAAGFLILACINSTGWIAPAVQGGINELSRWCLVISISALGMKTRLKELAAVGIKPILLMVGETVFLVVLVLLYCAGASENRVHTGLWQGFTGLAPRYSEAHHRCHKHRFSRRLYQQSPFFCVR